MTNLKQRLSDKINEKAAIHTDGVDSFFQSYDRLSFTDGANLLAPQIVELVEALKICAQRKECKSYECCASCGPIYEAEEALEKFNKFLGN